MGSGAIEALQIKFGIDDDLCPVDACILAGPLAKRGGQALSINLVFHCPGEGPVVGVAPLAGKELEGDERKSILDAGKHRVQIATHRCGR